MGDRVEALIVLFPAELHAPAAASRCVNLECRVLVSTSLGDSGCDRPDAASAIEAYVAVLLDAVIPGAELESKAEIESIADDSSSGSRRKERLCSDG